MSTLLPLEIRLQRWAVERPDDFPIRTVNYWNRYAALLDHLRLKIYPYINAGLACLSRSPGIYTDHGKEHFDEVVRYAGLFIEPTFLGNSKEVITPYDLYLLLSAIRLHDAGNIDGRELHERQAYSLLKEAGSAICPDDSEAHLIANIAQAHGGITEKGDKDTIGNLPEKYGFGPTDCFPRKVAALVRFSDEVCEHHNRASSHHIEAGTLPLGNMLFHLYALGVKQAKPERENKAFCLRLEFKAEHLGSSYPTPKDTSLKPEKKYLLDDALDRIQKLDSERLYCNRFLSPELRTNYIDVDISIIRTTEVQGIPIRQTWKHKNFLVEESGYPNPNNNWRKKQKDITGVKVAARLTKESAK
jgi:hypothetical protein